METQVLAEVARVAGRLWEKSVAEGIAVPFVDSFEIYDFLFKGGAQIEHRDVLTAVRRLKRAGCFGVVFSRPSMGSGRAETGENVVIRQVDLDCLGRQGGSD